MGDVNLSSFNRRHVSNSGKELGDCFRCLPEALILHILSFLPIKDAVKTSILSKQWRNLWSFTHILDFYSGNHLGDVEDFFTFIYRVLLHHAGNRIQKFRLCFEYKEKYTPDIDSWILFAVRKEVKELHLDLWGSYSNNRHTYVLPRALFDCKTLTTLKLSFCKIQLPDFMHFGSIKVLSLLHIKLNDDLIHKLIESCPHLEDLEMSHCRGLTHLYISPKNARLKRLKICNCVVSDGLEISAPNLQTLNIWEQIYKAGYTFRNLFSLVNAELDIMFCFDKEMFGWSGSYDIFEKLLEGLGHTRSLKLNSSCLQAYSSWELRRHLAPILKQKSLIVETGLQKWELPGLASLFRCSTDMDSLIIKIIPGSCVNFGKDFSKISEFDQRKYWDSQHSSFHCLLYSLKTVKIYNFMGGDRTTWDLRCGFLKRREEEVNLLKFLLQHAVHLEKMDICVSKRFCPKEILDVTQILSGLKQEILASPRASYDAQISLYFQ